jgi:hypothetical protein
MIEIDKAIVSLELIEQNFVCDTSICKGACCVHGDSGAPLETVESETLKKIYPKVKPYMQLSGIQTIDKEGVAVIDTDGDLVTPLIDGKECAFTYFENGEAKCAIEKAWFEKKVSFRKPVSCWLYPIRITKCNDFDAVNYHRWDICKCAVAKGEKEKTPVYVFLKEPLTQKYGSDWYTELEIAADMYLSEIKGAK